MSLHKSGCQTRMLEGNVHRLHSKSAKCIVCRFGHTLFTAGAKYLTTECNNGPIRIKYSRKPSNKYWHDFKLRRCLFFFFICMAGIVLFGNYLATP